jgi:amino acid transporter
MVSRDAQRCADVRAPLRVAANLVSLFSSFSRGNGLPAGVKRTNCRTWIISAEAKGMSSDHAAQGQAPQLGLWDAVSIILGIIIGAGIYETPPGIFQAMPRESMTYIVWAVCGILVFIGALCYAELATTYPRDGGDYVYLSRAYGPLVGYLFGWTQLAVIQTASIGLMAYIFAGYGARLFALPLGTDVETARLLSTLIYACAAIVVITAINLAGIRLGKPVQNFLTLIKVIGLVGIVVVAIGFRHRDDNLMVGRYAGSEEADFIEVDADPDYVRVEYDPFENDDIVVNKFKYAVNKDTKLLVNFKSETKDRKGQTVPVTLDTFKYHRNVVVVFDKSDPPVALSIRTAQNDMSLTALMGAMVLVLLTYGGWNDAAFVAAEVRHPSRNIPRALVLGTLGVMGIYLLINWAYVRALGWEHAQNANEIAADVLSLLPGDVGKHGEAIMCVLVMLSALGAMNGLIFTSSHIYATLGADYQLFSWLGQRSPRTGAPVASLFIQMVIALAMVIGVSLLRLSGLENSGFFLLTQCTAVVFWSFFLLTALSLFILRIKDRGRPRPFKVPAFPILPLIFVATCGYMIYSSVNFGGWLGLIGGGLVLAGVPLFFLSPRTPHPDPLPEPEDDVESAVAAGLPPIGPDDTGVASGEPPLGPAS